MRATPENLASLEAAGTPLLEVLVDDAEFYSELALKVLTKSGEEVPLVFNATQQILYAHLQKLMEEHGKIRLILLKARQFGGSTLIAAWIFHIVALRHFQRAKIVAHAQEHAIKLLNMYQHFYDALPPELKPAKKYQSKSELTFATVNKDEPGLNSALGVYSAKSSGAGRGDTVRHLHCSEVAFWDSAEKTMLGLVNSVPSSGDASRGTSIFIESTANGVGNYFYQKYYQAKRQEDSSEFHALFLPWYLHEEYTAPAPDGFRAQLSSEEVKLLEEEHEGWEFVNPETGCKKLSLGQLLWRRRCIATQCEGDESKFKQEYPLTDDEAFAMSGQGFFDIEQVQRRLETVVREVKPLFIGDLEWKIEKVATGKKRQMPQLLENTHYGAVTIWAHPEEGEEYVYFADVGEGLRDGDFSVIDIFRRRDGYQCAQYRKRIEPFEFATAIFNLGHYYKWAFGTPETNNHGLTTLVQLRELRYPYVYKQLVYDKDFADPREQEGWRTSPRTRPLMLDSLRNAFNKDEVVINSIVTLEEMKTFIKERGKFQAQDGCTDDCVMSAAGACQMLQDLPARAKHRQRNYLDEASPRNVKSSSSKKPRRVDPYTGTFLE